MHSITHACYLIDNNIIVERFVENGTKQFLRIWCTRISVQNRTQSNYVIRCESFSK